MKDFSELTDKELFNKAMECLLTIIEWEGSCYGMYDEIDALERIYKSADAVDNE